MMCSGDIKISVVIPAFNSQNTIEACLDSILLQSVENMELIVIDDGSADNTYEIVKKRAEEDPRIILVKQENAGPSAARNKGIELARGELLSFVDSDDVIYPDMFRLHLLYQKKYDADLAISGIRKIKKKGMNIRHIDVIADKLYFFSNKEEITHHFVELLNREAVNNPVGRFYKTEIIKNYNLAYDESSDMGEDLCFNIEYIDKASSILLIPEIFYQYNTFNSILTVRYRENLFDKRKRNIKLLEKFLEKNNIEKNFIYYYYIKLVYAVAMQEIEHGCKIKKRLGLIKDALESYEIQKTVDEYLPQKNAEKIMYQIIKAKSPCLIDLTSRAFVMARKSGLFYKHRISI